MIEAKQSPQYHEIMGNKDDMDRFLGKVNKTHDQIKGLIDGTLTPEDIDSQMTSSERLEVSRRELEGRKVRDFQLKGRPGKGHKGNYKLWCKRCHVEYWIDDIDKCTHCEGELMTEEVSSTNIHYFLSFLESSFFN